MYEPVNYFNNFSIFVLMGGFFGYIMFLMYLQSREMGKIIFRGGVFCPFNVIRYMINPFIAWYLWHPSLLRANWLVMIVLGSIIGYIIECILGIYMILFDILSEFY